MTLFLIILNFIIDGILILAVMTLMARIKKTEELEQKQKQTAREIEELFSSYLLEIKEENKRLSDRLASSGNDVERENVNKKKEIQKKEQTYSHEAGQVQSYQPPAPKEEESAYQPSLHSKVYQLKEQGLNNEEIARKLNKGKTEIDLLIKFQQEN
ncbi:hypothetical protein MUN89_13855 [Halobacillus salinarum]|uniref:Coupling factor for flagellin transcription and translation n=1 Tax=Halobacillus salinarum TaxID=2932257 RepID=A0ABY4EEY4_9BACI|nr:hypothetical protein [Halobacillus salinarum]UOQ43030.1 hypothetical protein MUN89_13855 [Halobacillus salinarum]